MTGKILRISYLVAISALLASALLFFGVYVALLDNVIITPVLVGISSLGA